LLGNSSKKRRELHFFTRNAFITTQSSREILPNQNMLMQALLASF